MQGTGIDLIFAKSKDMDYQKFKEEFDSTGLSQKEFGLRKSISSSMVSYYLRKAKAQELLTEKSIGFSALAVSQPALQEIKIITPRGLQIVIPV